MAKKWDFAGWATKYNQLCSDGRTIMNGAFDDCNGKTVPLVWNHNRNSVNDILGHAELESRKDGVYFYGYFNDTDKGKSAKELVRHGDISSVSIFANRLKERMSNVMHGDIKEVSLVIAPANPQAFIEDISFDHGEDGEYEAVVYSIDQDIIQHAEEPKEPKESEKEKPMAEETKKADDKSVQDIINSMTEEQQTVLYGMVGMALEENPDDEEDDMKHNLFEDGYYGNEESYGLSHADQEEIMKMAKQQGVGTLKGAIDIYMDHDSTLQHGFSDEDIETFFPEFKDITQMPPELITDDQSWVNSVINGASKSPFSRIRTRQTDIRNRAESTNNAFRGKGYVKGSEKTEIGNAKIINRTTDPQTIYVKDKLNRDDIIDITDFDIVQYIYQMLRISLNEEIAMAILIGDGRDDNDEDKISEEHIRSIYNDDEVYTIHQLVDIDTVRSEIQGTDTAAHFGDNYIYAEAIVQNALYARENYKGTGTPVFYCTPHLLNVMLLARDLNGRRIYENKSDLQAALNVSSIITVEQFEGITREVTGEENPRALLGIIVNMSDYTIGATKGGEITKFNDFDIDFNQYKYLLETRLSGALRRIKSAIVLEEPVSGE